MDKKENWYVLFVQTGQEQVLCSLLEDKLVHCFSAKIEFYKRVTQTIETQSLFPGYVFCLSEMDQMEFDAWLFKKPIKKGFIKELKYEQVCALSMEEQTVLKRLLDYDGVLKMSKGIKRNRKFHIVEGPLKDMDDYIVKYDSQHKLATLDLFFINQQWKAGIVEVNS